MTHSQPNGEKNSDCVNHGTHMRIEPTSVWFKTTQTLGTFTFGEEGDNVQASTHRVETQAHSPKYLGTFTTGFGTFEKFRPDEGVHK